MSKLQTATNQEALSVGLAAFQLSESELAVYYTVLELGCRPASKIAKHAGLNRPYTYDVLSTLVEKGLVLEVNKNSVKQFYCSPPDDLINLIHHRESELARQREQLLRALPMLRQIPRMNSSQPEFRYWSGLDGLRQMLEQSLTASDGRILSFVTIPYCGGTLEQHAPEWSNDFDKRRKAANVTYRCIATSNKHPAATDKNRSSTFGSDALRVAKKDMRFPIELFISSDQVAIIPEGSEHTGFTLENESLANACRSIHQLMWTSL